jgi:hypothetical protein
MSRDDAKSILEDLSQLSSEWDTRFNSARLNMVIHRDDVGWLANRFSEDVDRGLIEVEIIIRKAKNSCELDVIIRTMVDIMNTPAIQTAMGAALTLLLKEIKDGLMARTEKRMNGKEPAGVG